MFLVEYTDTFAGEANYCWVRRATIDAPNLRTALRRARKEFGLTGMRGTTALYGDEATWIPRGYCTILMVRWEY